MVEGRKEKSFDVLMANLEAEAKALSDQCPCERLRARLSLGVILKFLSRSVLNPAERTKAGVVLGISIRHCTDVPELDKAMKELQKKLAP